MRENATQRETKGLNTQYNDKGTEKTQLRHIRHNETTETKLNTLNKECKIFTIKLETKERKTDI